MKVTSAKADETQNMAQIRLLIVEAFRGSSGTEAPPREVTT